MINVVESSYEEALVDVGTVLSRYDKDDTYAVYGFGGQPGKLRLTSSEMVTPKPDEDTPQSNELLGEQSIDTPVVDTPDTPAVETPDTPAIETPFEMTLSSSPSSSSLSSASSQSTVTEVLETGEELREEPREEPEEEPEEEPREEPREEPGDNSPLEVKLRDNPEKSSSTLISTRLFLVFH